MPTEPQLLDESALAEIAEMFPHANYQPTLSPDEVDPCKFCNGTIDDHKANCVVPYVHALIQTVRVAWGERLRLLNLVRYCRYELLDKKLITQEEFASLLEEGSAAHLETYDQLRAENAALREQLGQAQARIALWFGPNSCSVCGGAPLVSGRPCVCGGKGTMQAEFEGLRQELFDSESRLAQVEKESQLAIRFLVKQGYERCAQPEHGCDGWHERL